MITVEEAEEIILAQAADYGAEIIPFDLSLGRVLAENIKADRDTKSYKQGDLVASIGQVMTPALISVVASVGETELRVKKLPRVVVLSSGDDLVDLHQSPAPDQERRSDNYAIKAVLQKHHSEAGMLHLPDNAEIAKKQLKTCLENYDVLLLTAGNSDIILTALGELNVEQLFGKVEQHPAEQFWFGKHSKGQLVFVFPGDQVDAFICLHRYFLPWLNASLGIQPKPAAYAILNEDVSSNYSSKYFLPVTLDQNELCQLSATPADADIVNLTEVDGFLELPSDANKFSKGETFKVWQF